MTLPCPCCGQPVADVSPEAVALALAPRQRRLFDVIVRAPGTTAERLAWLLYEDVNGGPEDAVNAIRRRIRHLNRRLRAYGLRVAQPRQTYAGYRLTKDTAP
jgi:hypothetical protein